MKCHVEGKGGYTEKYENCCLAYMAVCVITILELSDNLSHYEEEKSVWLHIRAGKEISQLAIISLFQQNYQARLLTLTWQANIHLDDR